MKNLISKEEKDRIDSICKLYNITDYTINSDGTIDVNGSVVMTRRKLKQLPLKFGTVSEYFICSGNALTSLYGAPTKVGEDFDCGSNFLTNLEYAPIEVGGNYVCGFNNLTDLIGSPSITHKNFLCVSNLLTSLNGCPEEIHGDMHIGNNRHLQTLYLDNDVDVDLSGDLYTFGTNLPFAIQTVTDDYLKIVFKYQRHYDIWNEDLSLNEINFKELISEIEDGLL